MAKTIFDTNETFTSGNNVAIGEMITYEITLDLPAGLSFSNVVVTDRLDKGLAFVDCLFVDVAGTNMTGTVCPPTVTSITNPGDSAGNPANAGRQVAFNIGSISGPASNSTLVIRYRAIVLDVIENQDGGTLDNNVTWSWTGGSISTDAPDVTIVEPDLGIDKSANTTTASTGTPITFTINIFHTAQSTADAFDVVVTDVLPAGLTYNNCSVVYSGLVPNNAPNDCPLGVTTLSYGWDSFPLGATATITFTATLNGTQNTVTNTASVAWSSLPIDPGLGGAPVQLSVHNPTSTERLYDPGDPVNIYSVADAITINPAVAVQPNPNDVASRLPGTGFAQDRITVLPRQPLENIYAATSLRLEIPRLGLDLPIVGVPLVNDEWDVTWLANQAGWLNGTAYPTLKGNSVLTGHVYDANGKPGPFVNLGNLKWDDRIIIHANGYVYIYQVRENVVLKPNDLSALRHEEDEWLTLITCKTYDQATNSYRNRIVIRAELVSVEKERTVSPPGGGR
jgi:LPXTG-site transpeptidase (sortase) family protein